MFIIQLPPHFLLDLQERIKAEALNRHLRQQLADYQAPDITEYMEVKEKHKRLQQSVHMWERKVRVAEVSAYFIWVRAELSARFSDPFSVG